ncbi:MAG: thioredoxin-dependent thiol peroxidase [Dehalococcoidia bacterium]|jgi:peroxiredoxin Q/BCP
MPALAIDSLAPDFALQDQDGNTVSRDSLKGRWAVIYFYPRDDTPGCTREACNFRDNFAALKALGADVLGVSGDSAAAHKKFAAKYELPFTLLVDAGNEMARAYGAWGKKNMYGKTYEGIIRSTVVISPEGKVARVWPKVKPDSHGEEVLEWLKSHAG